MVIKVKIIANSSRQSIEEISPSEFKIKLKSAPVEGKANKELIDLLSEYFKVAKSQINIVRGETAKNKILDIKK